MALPCVHLYENLKLLLLSRPSNSLNSPAPGDTAQPSTNSIQGSSHLKTQQVENFNFKYPADWKFPTPEWKENTNYSYVYIVSPDINLALPGGFLESGIRVVASNNKIKEYLLMMDSATIKSLDELENHLKNYRYESGEYYTYYEEIIRTKVAGFDALNQ